MGYLTVHDTITRIFGPLNTVFSDNGSSMTNWATPTTWGTTTAKFYSSPTSITDSPNLNYADNANTNLILKNAVALTGAVDAELSFYARWEIEPGFDYTEVSASVSPYTTWVPLCGKYTSPGSQYQDVGQPLYDGFQTQWVHEEINLSAYLAQSIKLRFALRSDGGSNYDGFYFDDLMITKVLPTTTGISEVTADAIAFTSAPNPASEFTNFIYSLPSTTKNAHLKIYDAVGQLVFNQELKHASAEVMIDTQNFSNGIYNCVIEADNMKSGVQRLVVAK
jgi:hypothetical protein